MSSINFGNTTGGILTGNLTINGKWSGANEYTKYESSKIGLGQPEWWYKYW